MPHDLPHFMLGENNGDPLPRFSSHDLVEPWERLLEDTTVEKEDGGECLVLR